MSERIARPPSGRVVVRAPASSANLGPGFDSLGLCLELADFVTAEVVERGTEVSVVGEGAAELAADDTNLVVSSLRGALDLWDFRQPGLRVTCLNAIPQGRGLGSSAAAVVAGFLLARELAGRDDVGSAEALTFSAAVEGHADNVAACLLGGLVIAWNDRAAPTAIRLDVDPRVVPMVFCADLPMSTKQARALLPGSVTHRAASANAARAALLVVALTQRPELLLSATYDLLHQEARRAGMPESLALVDSLRAAGIAAVVSGAGPSVLALGTAEQADQLTDEVREGWRLLALPVDRQGACVVPAGAEPEHYGDPEH